VNPSAYETHSAVFVLSNGGFAASYLVPVGIVAKEFFRYDTNFVVIRKDLPWDFGEYVWGANPCHSEALASHESTVPVPSPSTSAEVCAISRSVTDAYSCSLGDSEDRSVSLLVRLASAGEGVMTRETAAAAPNTARLRDSAETLADESAFIDFAAARTPTSPLRSGADAGAGA